MALRFRVRYQILILVFTLAYAQYLVGSIVHMRQLNCPKEKKIPTSDRSSANKKERYMDTVEDKAVTSNSKADLPYVCQWSETQWQTIAQASLYGELTAYLPGGFIGDYYGVRWILFLTTIIFSIANSLGVLLAPLHWLAFFSFRVVYGLAAGFMRPALMRYVVNWATPKERCRFCAAVMTGHCIAFCMNHVLWNSISLDWTWKFHLVSIQIAVITVLFWFLGSEAPNRCKRITEDEALEIENAQDASISNTKVIPPFKYMFSSSEVWAVTIVHFGNNWGVYCLMKLMPGYINKILVKSEGHSETQIIGLLPYACRGVAGIGFGILGDVCVKRQWLNRTMAIQIMAVFSHLIPGLAMMGVGTIKTLATGTIVLMIVGALNGAIVVSTLKSSLDLAPNFTATIFSINSMFAQLATVCAQQLRVMLQDNVDNVALQWTLNFLVGGGMMFSTGLIFVFFASGETNWWNDKRLLIFKANKENTL